MDNLIKGRWKLTVSNGWMRLHDESQMVSHKEYTGSSEVPKYYNILVNDKNGISVIGVVRYSRPKLPKYLKEEIIKFVKEVKGDGNYTILNE
jgi:hypothetical protein